jgi:ribosomal protein S18 acetylase RimI-like enzyme
VAVWEPGGRATASPPPELAYRLLTPEDLPFLAELYASTRREELAQAPWSPAEREAFLRWQFAAQHRHYQDHYPDCEFLVIERLGGAAARTPIGRLYLDRREDELRVVDIALLPDDRGRRLGTAILERVLAEGRERGLPVCVHVESENPALRLYQRLGFRHVETHGVYQLMRWSVESDREREGQA